MKTESVVSSRQEKRITISAPRIDALERVSGRARYCADWMRADMLYGRIVQSTVPHGVVKNIDATEALEMRGVKAVITCKTDQTIWNAGEREHPRRVFTERVRFVGDCIGAVAATSREAAVEGVGKIKVDYEELPPVFNIEDALKPGSPNIWEDGNVIGPLDSGYGNFDSAMGTVNGAPFVLEANYSTSRVHNCPLEPAVSLAWWDGDNLTVVAATQGIFGCREGLSHDLRIPVENIRVISQYKGGGFGNKNSSMNYDVIASLLAGQTNRPVMVEYSRQEEFVAVHGRWSTRQHLEGILDAHDGRLVAVKLNADCDIGAYTRRIKTGSFVEGTEDYYSCIAWSASVRGVYTNTPATAHMRAPTGPQSCFASECFLDEAAYRLGVNPLEMRLRNSVVKYHNSKSMTSNYMRECLLEGAERFGWSQRWMPPDRGSQGSETGTNMIGVGLAMASWHARLGRGEALVKLKQDGNAEVYTGVVDIGTGAKSTMALIASEALGIAIEDVEVIWGDTLTCPYSVGESGSRTTTFTGYAVREAASKIRDRVLALASEQTGLPNSALELSRGWVVESSSGNKLFHIEDVLKIKKLGEIVEKALTEPKLPENQERFSFAAHFAEVNVDRDTGEITVDDYLAMHESGKIVNTLTAKSQVQGGVVMGLGMALSEKLLIDPNYGSIMNPSFYSYHLPNIVSMPRIRVEFLDSDDPYGPKSLGEIPIVPVPAAIGNAIFNATGVRLRDLPFSQERLSTQLSSLKLL